MTACPALRPEHEAVLSLLLHGLEDCGSAWALTGSASFALQGVRVEVRDIDVQTCATGAYAIQERLTDPGLGAGPGGLDPVMTIRRVRQSEAGAVRSHLGVFSVGAVRMEVMGAIQKRGDGGDWESPVNVAALRSFVEWKGRWVPVLPLEYEFGAYVQLGRLERATLLRDALLARWMSRGIPLIQCSTGSLALLGGGNCGNVAAMLKGVQALGWPFIELRLWRDPAQGTMEEAAHRVAETGARVVSVHAPPATEVLLSTPGRETDATRLLRECLAAAAVCRARVLVVHAWDVRLPAFSLDSLVANLNRACHLCLAEGVTLSVETIPGHSGLLPGLVKACPLATYTADTQWAALDGSWAQLYALVPKITNVHVQTYVDEEGAIDHTAGVQDVVANTATRSGTPASAGRAATVPAGRVQLGRTASGYSFNAGAVVQEFRRRGYSGLITLEPNRVLAAGAGRLRSALLLLRQWVPA